MDSPPSVTICTQEMEVVHDFGYLGSMISDTLSLDVELDECTGKAATMFSKLTKTVWLNKLMACTVVPRIARLIHSGLTFAIAKHR